MTLLLFGLIGVYDYCLFATTIVDYPFYKADFDPQPCLRAVKMYHPKRTLFSLAITIEIIQLSLAIHFCVRYEAYFLIQI